MILELATYPHVSSLRHLQIHNHNSPSQIKMLVSLTVGKVDAGVPFSSVVYGTGCRYDLTVDVNSVGTVTFWERPQGAPARVPGSAEADGAIATISWVPRRVATTQLYATQNGVTGPVAVLRVHQGYGSGWACFAL